MNLTCLKSGIWQAELRVPEDVRDIIGKTRFAKSMRTRNKCEAFVKAHRNAYGERITEAQEQQLERRLTKLCQMD